MNCYCCSGRAFEDCCEPFINNAARPQTAEALMRSRYSAYVTIEVEYLRRTTHPGTRRFFDTPAVEKWARASRWQRLEIVSTDRGDIKDKAGTVEFKAYYLDPEGDTRIHHERSNFIKELGRWFFVDGKIIGED